MNSLIGMYGINDGSILESMKQYYRDNNLIKFESHSDDYLILSKVISKAEGRGFTKPIYNEKKDIVLLFNGNIFEFEQIKKKLESEGHIFSTNQASEIIIHLYEESQMAQIDKINGDFIFALYDSNKKRLILCTDSTGSRSLYYSTNTRGIFFASDIRPLLKTGLFEIRPNINAVSHYMTFFTAHPEKSLIDNIELIPPSSYLEINKRRLRVKSYITSKQQNYQYDLQNIIFRIKHLIVEAVNNRNIRSRQVHIALGGLDSSIITAILSGSNQKINTYTIGYNSKIDEFNFARDVSDRFGTNHKEIYFDNEDIWDYFDESLPNLNHPHILATAPLFQTKLYKNIHFNRGLFFNGEGADALFGPEKTGNIVKSNRVKDICFKGLMFSKYKNYNALKSNLFYSQYLSHYLGFNGKTFYSSKRNNTTATTGAYSFLNKFDFPNASIVHRLINLDLKLQYFFEELKRLETSAKLYGLVNCSPYLDKSLIEFIQKVPPEYLYQTGFNKILLFKAMKEFLPNKEHIKKIGMGEGGITIANQFLQSNKHLLSDVISRSEIFNQMSQRFLRKAVQRFERTTSGEARFYRETYRAYALLSLGMWYDNILNLDK